MVSDKWFIKKEDGVVVHFSEEEEDRLEIMGGKIFGQVVVGLSETGPWKSINRRAKDQYRAMVALAKNQSRYRAWGIFLVSVIIAVVAFVSLGKNNDVSPGQEVFILLLSVGLGFSVRFACYYFIIRKLMELPVETRRKMWVDLGGFCGK